MNYLELKIKEVLVQENKTMKWLADEIGYSRQGLTNGLSNKTIKYGTLEKIADVLNLRTFLAFPPKGGDKDDPKFIDTFLDGVDMRIALMLCSRYNRFSDRLDCIKDYFVWDVLDSIILGYMPRYTSPFSANKEPLLTDKQFNHIKEKLPSGLKEKPFSNWSEEPAKIINSTSIFKAFYFTIFKKNYMNIIQYIEDDMIKDNEILKYWKEWNKV